MQAETTQTRAALPLYAHLQYRHGEGGFALDAEFVLNAGITILFGASGAGKTTLLDCLAGLVTPNSGRVTLGDRVLFDSEQRIDVATPQRRLGYLFQNLALFPHLSARQNVAYGLSSLGRNERARRTDAMLDSLGILRLGERRPAELSGGERQRVALARALVTGPEYLLLDEPLVALDAPTKSRLVGDLRAWNREHQIPILYVTHDRGEVYALGERVLVLDAGGVIAEGEPREVLDAPRQESVAHLAGFENIFEVEVVETRSRQGTMSCRVLPRIDDPARALQTVFSSSAQPVKLEAPLARVEMGERVRIGVRAGDILLATEHPKGLSARNIIPARIASITASDAFAVVQADCEGVRFEVHVTPGAVESLGLAQGRNVWLVIKTHSCHLLLNITQGN